MQPSFYILENGQTKEEPDLLKWAAWMEQNKRQILLSTLNNIKISTVFLGINHNFGEGEPILFETMIFGGTHDQYQDRYHTEEEAVEGHTKAMELVMDEQKYKGKLSID